MPQSLRILHISDLHERGPGEREAYRRQRVLGAGWRRNLDELLGEGAIDLVCVTGDVANWGKPAEYEAATAFFNELLEQLSLTRQRLFIVPGNHDIERPVEKSAWLGLRDALGRGADRLGVGRWMAGLAAEPPLGVQTEWREAVLARQAAYRTWLRDTLGRPELAPNGTLGYRVTLSLAHWPEPVQVIGLDTAWLAGDHADPGRLLLTDTQLMCLATDAHGTPLPGLRLALMHHPFQDLADGQDARRIAADCFDVVLRGHLHQTGFITWQDPDRRFTEFAVGCLYEGHGADRYPNACQVLTLFPGHDEALCGENRFRAFAPGGGHWHDDDSLYRESRAGRLAWALPSRAAAITTKRPVPRAAPAAPVAKPSEPWNPTVPPGFGGRAALERALDHALGEANAVHQQLRRGTHNPRGRFVHAEVRAGSLLEFDSAFSPYRATFDVTSEPSSAAAGSVKGFFWFPPAQRVREATLQTLIPAAAVCTANATKTRAALARSLARSAGTLDVPFGELGTRRKELVLESLTGCFDGCFVAAVVMPSQMFSLSRLSPALAYHPMIQFLLVPLLEMHQRIGVPRFDIRLERVDQNTVGGASFARTPPKNPLLDLAKKSLKASYKGKGTVALVSDEERLFCFVGHLVAWAVLRQYNNDGGEDGHGGRGGARRWAERLDRVFGDIK